MQPILDHLSAVIRPALRRYIAAEKALTEAVLSNDTSAIETARTEAGLAARQAVDVLHHLADFVLKEPQPTLQFTRIEDVRDAVEARCDFLRTGNAVGDVSLLRDVADAFKHHRLDRQSATVLASSDVTWVSMGFGQMRFGEGKFGGVEQIVITKKDSDMRAVVSFTERFRCLDEVAWATAATDQPILDVLVEANCLRCNFSRLILREQLRRRTPPSLLFVIGIRKLLL
jgi:hypothetical protein